MAGYREMVFILLLVVIGAAGMTGYAAGAAPPAMMTYIDLPLPFIKNEGQKDKEILFYREGMGHAAYFTREGVSLSFGQSGKVTLSAAAGRLTPVPLGAAAPPTVEAVGRQEGKVNYFTGRDPGKWRTDVAAYSAVVYRNIYPGIDMKFHGPASRLRYEITLSPGKDPGTVRLSCKGAERLTLTPQGDLEMALPQGSLMQRRPFVYQAVKGRRIEVGGRLVLQADGAYGFETGAYDRKEPLVIASGDIYWSHGEGGDGVDYYIRALAMGPKGNLYVAGEALSTDSGTGPEKGRDVFVAGLSPSGDRLLYATYLGGAGDDRASAIAVDSSGNAYVAGLTDSPDLPGSAPGEKSGEKGFAIKLSSSGNLLVYAALFEGNGATGAVAIAVDSSGHAYVTGSTLATDLPVRNAWQSGNGGDRDAFIAKLDPGGEILYSTFLGGAGEDRAAAIAVDSSGHAYVTGRTCSDDFPVKNPCQGSRAGACDAFVAKLSPSGDALLYATYLGGSAEEYTTSLAVDSSGSVYTGGYTYSPDFPAPGRCEGSGARGFVAALDPSGNTVTYSTCFAGKGRAEVLTLAVDPSGSTSFAGRTDSDACAADPSRCPLAESWEAFFARLDPCGDSGVYPAYLGASGAAHALVLDTSGNGYIAGITRPRPPDPDRGYGPESFIARLGTPRSRTCGATRFTVTPWAVTFTSRYTLKVTKSGNGGGVVTSAPPGIACGTDCTQDYTPGSIVTLLARAAQGSIFTSWSGGGCNGAGVCRVTMKQSENVNANFVLRRFAVSASVRGGHGTVSPGTQTADYGGSALITITPDPGYHIAAITDNGTARTISNLYKVMAVTSARNVVVIFAAHYTLKIRKSGTGTGAVASSPAGINCGTACSAAFARNSGVKLAVRPAASSTFTGWSGACAGKGACIVSMGTDKEVTACFAIKRFSIAALAPAGHGTVTPPSQTVDYGGTAVIAISPDTGYRIARIADNGVSRPVTDSYKLAAITTPHVVTVVFAKKRME